MAATTRDQEEQNIKIIQMSMNIEKMKADIKAQQTALEHDSRRFTVWLIMAVGVGFAVGVGVALFAVLNRI